MRADPVARPLSRPLPALILGCVLAVATAAFVLHGLAAPLRTDYLAMLTGGRLMATHQAACLYCPGAQLQVQRELLGQPVPRADPFLESPPVAALFAPLSNLGLLSGMALLVVAGLTSAGAGAVVAWVWLGLRAQGWAGASVAVLGALSVPAAWNYMLGQTDSLLVLPLMAGATLLVRGRRTAAGLLLSLLLVKPQTVWMVPVVLVIAGDLRVLAGMAAGGAALGGASVAIAGVSGLERWAALAAHQGPALDTSLGLPGAVAWMTGDAAGMAAAAIGAVLAVVLLVRHRRRLAQDPLAALAVGIVLSAWLAPHVFAYDLVLMLLPLVALARRHLTAALACGVGLTLAHVVDTYLVVSAGLHAETAFLALLLVALWRGLTVADVRPAQLSRSAAAVEQPAR